MTRTCQTAIIHLYGPRGVEIRRKEVTLMTLNEISIKNVYVVKDTLAKEGFVYAYVRGWRGNEVGFSVLEQALDDPDLSQCGVFWVRPEDFIRVFDVYKSGYMRTGSEDTCFQSAERS